MSEEDGKRRKEEALGLEQRSVSQFSSALRKPFWWLVLDPVKPQYRPHRWMSTLLFFDSRGRVGMHHSEAEGRRQTSKKLFGRVQRSGFQISIWIITKWDFDWGDRSNFQDLSRPPLSSSPIQFCLFSSEPLLSISLSHSKLIFLSLNRSCSRLKEGSG